MLFPLRLDHLLERDKIHQAELYHSEWNRWIPGECAAGSKLQEAACVGERGGYRLLRFLEQQV